ncbi:vignain [Eucalyptus grandis]|uniref:vignain n=1 Tax=Eucalyptus grandis TaxID=71139 RepID=UPI00192EE7D6|nr:vignain [Eucalyptus grandis]
MKTGKLVDLPEQQLIDYSKQNHGCGWGWMYLAYEYIAQNHGMTYESDYPYSGFQGTCNERAASIAAVARQPVSIAIEGFSPGFKQYSGGVFNGPCGETTNNAVAIVGYGKTPDGVDYWLLKNSWGDTWGEKGYMRILRNSGVQGGFCGLVTQATLPVAD